MTRAGYIDPNWPNPNGPHDARIIIYGYVPSFALCIIAVVLFVLAFLVHAGQIAKYRTWYFIPLVVGLGFEVVGYVSRSLSAKKDPYNITFFVLQYFFIVTAPIFITASIYVCLNKLIAWAQQSGYDAEQRHWLHPRIFLWGFVTCDVVTTIVQIVGAALIGNRTSDGKDPTTANNILLVGLAIQTFAFTTFLVILVIFVLFVQSDRGFGPSIGAKSPFVAALICASVLVLLRIVFRLAETSQGVFGYLMVHEAFFGVLEFAPVVVAVWILAIWHPGRCIQVALSAEGKSASQIRYVA
ncbi:parasitic phase-specific protein PSP-1 [Rhizodiscina lignyota]|uniref:Parasitic phase-specific protein PSP-1 n=1 Tax=Rhizodiscina lignyota TaxID=1504668 RepID=A0A9P4I993_9PEZI|nr:parasitic phase-specific protein PSP-1 [Rhizodiscina lignyota]